MMMMMQAKNTPKKALVVYYPFSKIKREKKSEVPFGNVGLEKPLIS